MPTRRTTRALAVTIGILACAAVVPAVAGACANPATVKSFQGQAHLILALTATGTSPGTGGTETVTLQRHALNLHLHLAHKLIGKKPGTSFFGGTMTGGSVTVEDLRESSAEGFEAKLSYHGPLTKEIPNHGRAELVFSRSKCRYELELSFGVKATFEGDGELDTSPEATGGMQSGFEPLPHSMYLADSGKMDAYLTCPDAKFLPACYSFGGTWTTDFATLALCGSVVAVGCKDDTEPVGTASVGWSLKPTLEKKK